MSAASDRARPLVEIAAERTAYSEAIERIGRFALGANRSRLYAAELREWLETHYASDERFERVIALLGDYRVKYGQQEVADACRLLIGRVEHDITGRRFPWRGTAPFHERWRLAFETAHQGGPLKATCPFCGSTVLRLYIRGGERELVPPTQYRPGATDAPAGGWSPVSRAGGWAWCSNCYAYEHWTGTLPDWWRGDPVLDDVPENLLEHSPEFLERALRIAAARSERPAGR